MKAIWNGEVIAESKETIMVEGNHYFPVDSVKKEYLVPSKSHTTCPWKGEASYHSVKVKGEINSDAAWYYPEPKYAAEQIRNHIAFWKGVKISV